MIFINITDISTTMYSTMYIYIYKYIYIFFNKITITASLYWHFQGSVY